jgi:hypothetical protein
VKLILYSPFLLIRYWYDAAVNFHSAYVATGMVKSFETDVASKTFGLLLNLVVFFDKYQASHLEEAASLMDRLDILPNSQGDISNYVGSYYRLDFSVKQNIPAIILASMESLCSVFTTFKSQLNRNGGGASPESSTLMQKISELRQRSRVLVTFAGLINSSGVGQMNETNARLAKLEACMM